MTRDEARMPDIPPPNFVGAMCEIWFTVSYAAYHLAYTRVYLQTRAMQTHFNDLRTSGPSTTSRRTGHPPQGATRASAGVPATLRMRIWRIFSVSITKMLCFCGAIAWSVLPSFPVTALQKGILVLMVPIFRQVRVSST